MEKIIFNPWVWLSVAIIGFSLCTFLPLVKDDDLRKKLYWLILVPVSLVIIFYVYPMGLELFRRLGVSQ